MPKVYVRGTTSSDEQARLTASSRAILRSYYCICGEFILVMQGKLDRLARRMTDESYIIRSKDSPDGKVQAKRFKMNAEEGERVLIERPPKEGSTKPRFEIRQQLTCAVCRSTVAYQAAAMPVGSGPFIYVLPGALTETQGRIPADAFDDEPEAELDADAEAEAAIRADSERHADAEERGAATAAAIDRPSASDTAEQNTAEVNGLDIEHERTPGAAAA